MGINRLLADPLHDPYDVFLMKETIMKSSPIVIFAAGFIAGGIVFGGAVAHARIVTLNAAIAGVLPNSEGSLFCVTAASVLRPIKGVSRETDHVLAVL